MDNINENVSILRKKNLTMQALNILELIKALMKAQLGVVAAKFHLENRFEENDDILQIDTRTQLIHVKSF